MIQIRHNVFETNSSSTHSLTMCTSDEYREFEKGHTVLYRRRFISVDELIDNNPNRKDYSIATCEDWNDPNFICKLEDECIKLLEKIKDEALDEDDAKTLYNEYGILTKLGLSYVEGCYETFKQEYTSPSGDNIVAFGYYGYD